DGAEDQEDEQEVAADRTPGDLRAPLGQALEEAAEVRGTGLFLGVGGGARNRSGGFHRGLLFASAIEPMQFKPPARKNARFRTRLTPKRRLALLIGSKPGCAGGWPGHILRSRMAGRGRPGKAEEEAGAAGTASRLRHDLGKYIRLSAPASIESDTE